MRLSFESGELEQIIRKLAKSDKYQAIYNSKEAGLRLFDNVTDISYAQQLFMSFVGMYSSLNTDIFLGDISDKVLENNIYEDSYLLYKSKEHQKKKVEKPVKDNNKELIGSTQLLFKKRRK